MLSQQNIESILQAAEKEGAEGLKRYQELLNIKDAQGNTLLHLAIRRGNEKAAIALIAAKVDIQAVGQYDRTPLHWAALKGLVSIVTLLLGAGARVDVRDNNKVIPLHLALACGKEEAAKALIAAKADIHAVGEYGRTPLHAAAHQGLISVMTLLLEARALVDARDVISETPLHLALWCGKPEAAKALIVAKADIHAVGTNDYTPLHWAALKGLVSIVTLLLGAGARVDVRDGDEDTPLHAALVGGGEEVAKVLIAAKADIHAVGENGRTPLYLAARRNLSSLLVLLLEKGARWDFKEEYDTDAYRLLRIYEVIKPCFAASNLFWLAKCIESLYLAEKPDPLFNQQADLKTFFENNFQKIEKLFFEHHAAALQEAEKILSLPQVAIRKFLTPILLKHIRELYFTVRNPEIFWEPFLGALALQNADCQLLEKSMPDIQNQRARMQKLLSHNALPDALSIIALEYLGWVTCSPSPTQEDQKLRGEINRMLGQSAPNLGLSLYNTQFALCRAHFHRLNTGKGQQSLYFAEILDSPGRLLPAFEMRRSDKGQQQQQKDKAGARQDPKPAPKADPKPAPGAAASSAKP